MDLQIPDHLANTPLFREALFNTSPPPRPLAPPTPPSPAARDSSSSPSHQGYHPLKPQYIYADNGDGSIYRVGVAGPSDFHPNGTIRGIHPSPTHLINFEHSSSIYPRSLSPMQTQEPSSQGSPSASSLPSGISSPPPKEHQMLTLTPPSLPAEGAQPED